MTFGAVRSPSLVAMRSTESPCAVSRDRDSPPRPNLRSSQFDGRRQAIHPRQKHGATRVELSTSPVRCAITQHHANTRRQPTSIPPTTFLPRKNVRSWYGNRQTFQLQNYPLTCLEKQPEAPYKLLPPVTAQTHRTDSPHRLTAQTHRTDSPHRLTAQTHRTDSPHRLTAQTHRTDSPHRLTAQTHRSSLTAHRSSLKATNRAKSVIQTRNFFVSREDFKPRFA